MLNFDPDKLTTKEQKKLLIGSVIPRPIALVSTVDESGDVANVAPFSYFNIVTFQPAMLSIAVQRQNGEVKDTARNILEKREAVVHTVDQDNVEEANKTSAALSADESELDVSGFTSIESVKVDTPAVKEAKIRFETTLYDSLIIYDGDLPTTDLLLLKVEHFHLSEDVYQDGYVLSGPLRSVSRLAGNDYAEIGKKFTVERPE